MSARTLSRTTSGCTVQATLLDLIDRIAADDTIKPKRRQDITSALRTLGKIIGQPLADIPAHPGLLAKRLNGFLPAAAGLSANRWANIQSLVRFALKHAALLTVPGRHRDPLSPAWTALFAGVTERQITYGLSRLAHYCSAKGVDPTELNDAQMDSFRADLSTGALVAAPREIHRSSCRLWNKAASAIPTWPQTVLTVPDYRKHYALLWDAFPVSLKADVDAYLERLAGNDIFAEQYFRPLRPVSVANRQKLLRAYLSALVSAGREPQTLRSLADAVPIDVVKQGLRVFLDRAGGKPTAYVHEVACVLTAVATYWVKVDTKQVDQLKDLCKRLNTRGFGMTDKNRDRLRQFDDPANVNALLTLPAKLVARATRDAKPTLKFAREVETALALELLLMIPMRLKNLAEIEVDRHIVRSYRGVVQLVIPGHEVKNGADIEAVLPAAAVRLLDLYVRDYRPLLLDGPSAFLFPGLPGKAKSLQALRVQITETVKRHCGLQTNPHLFRHIAAKLYLDANPGAYGVVRLLLGHKSIETTIKFYCGTETAAAFNQFDQHILKLRQGLTLKNAPAAGGRA